MWDARLSAGLPIPARNLWSQLATCQSNSETILRCGGITGRPRSLHLSFPNVMVNTWAREGAYHVDRNCRGVVGDLALSVR